MKLSPGVAISCWSGSAQEVAIRADAAFAKPETYEALEAAGLAVSGGLVAGRIKMRLQR